MSVAVFVDYDATVTDRDTFDVLVRHAAGEAAWEALDGALIRGEISLREALARQAALVCFTLDEADAYLQTSVIFDPAFTPFANAVRKLGASLEIVSSGVAPLIRRSLVRNGAGDVPLVANDVTPSSDGWIMHFRDDSPNGTDKAARVRAASERGDTTVYIGDGISDFEAALVADVRYAKRKRALEEHLRRLEVPFVPFASFAEIDPCRLVTSRSFEPVRSFLEDN